MAQDEQRVRVGSVVQDLAEVVEAGAADGLWGEEVVGLGRDVEGRPWAVASAMTGPRSWR